MSARFIKTDDPKVAEELRKQGFTEIPHYSSKDLFCFLNDNKLKFNGKGKVIYSNTLSM